MVIRNWTPNAAVARLHFLDVFRAATVLVGRGTETRVLRKPHREDPLLLWGQCMPRPRGSHEHSSENSYEHDAEFGHDGSILET